MSALAYDDDEEAWVAVGAEIANELKRRDARINALEAQVARLAAALEAIGELKYCGIWKDGREYLRGNFTTVGGSLWHCEQTTRTRPGTDETWRLAVKRGTCT